MSRGRDLIRLAEAILDVAGDRQARDEFERGMEVVDADGEDVGIAAFEGILKGIQTTEQTAVESGPGQTLPHRVTEIQDAYGNRLGLKIYVAAPRELIDVYEGDDGLLVKGESGEFEVPLSFEVDEPVIEENDGHTEIMIRDAGWEPASGALPEGETNE